MADKQNFPRTASPILNISSAWSQTVVFNFSFFDFSKKEKDAKMCKLSFIYLIFLLFFFVFTFLQNIKSYFDVILLFTWQNICNTYTKLKNFWQ